MKPLNPHTIHGAAPADDSGEPGCAVCGTHGFEPVAPVDPRYGRMIAGEAASAEGPFWLARCSCGHLALRPVPSTRFLAAFYEQYMRTARGGFYRRHFDEAAAEGGPAERARRRARALRLRCSGGRVLDVGCGPGTFLRAARGEGFVPFGLEPNPEAAEAARTGTGATVLVAPVEQVPLPDGAFDAVTLWDVLEHLRDPASALTQVRRLLRPGGWIAIETPDARSLLHRVARTLYRATGGRVKKPMAIYDVHHLHYFSGPGLARLLRSLGFVPAGGWRESTPLDQYAERPYGRLVHAGLRGLFATAEVLGWQNKMVVFARRA